MGELMKKRSLVSNKSREKMPQMKEIEQSIDLKVRNKNRGISN